MPSRGGGRDLGPCVAGRPLRAARRRRPPRPGGGGGGGGCPRRMLARRITPCLDVGGGGVVRGGHLASLGDAGNPVERRRATTPRERTSSFSSTSPPVTRPGRPRSR